MDRQYWAIGGFVRIERRTESSSRKACDIKLAYPFVSIRGFATTHDTLMDTLGK